MKLTFDPRYNVAYLRFQEKSVQVETIRLSEELNVDMGPDGKVYGIELLNANQQLGALIGGKFVLENAATGTEQEVLIS